MSDLIGVPHSGGSVRWFWRDDQGQVRMRELVFKALTGADDRLLPASIPERRGLRHIQPTNVNNRSILYDLQQAGMIDAERALTARGLAVRDFFRKEFPNHDR